MIRIITILFLMIFSITSYGQEKSKAAFKFQGDSRRTFVDRQSVGITGVRGGFLFNNKYEMGLGIYSSNLFGLLGSNVQKDYVDNKVTPSVIIPSEIGFHYASIYGEYVIIENNRLKFTANTQLGLGRVDIDFIEASQGKEGVREPKSLVEHSIKVDVQTLRWLRLIGGVGYRYLLNGEDQVKKAFNAPIYIVGFSIDFKKLFNKKKEL